MIKMFKKYRAPLTVGKDLLFKKYPAFVYGGNLHNKQIPIFVFHEVIPSYFEGILKFLKENQYTTLSVHELFSQFIDKNVALPEKSIVITFDDGDKSVWTVAYPLLKKYNFTCTTFLIPGRMQEGQTVGVNLFDYWQGKCSEEELIQESKSGLANWKEIEQIYRDGVMDFQSHSNGHELVFTSNKVLTYVTPDILQRFHHFEFPREQGDEVPLGRPIYNTAPRLSDALKCNEDQQFKTACIEFVAKNGGVKFFNQSDWQEKLDALHRNTNQVFESEQERDEQIYADLLASKTAIEARLGNQVEHLCLPWGVGGMSCIQNAKKAGYRAIYWGKVDGKLIFDIDKDDPLKTSRIGEDFIFLLPGEGRQNVFQLVKKKFNRRMNQGTPFLSH